MSNLIWINTVDGSWGGYSDESPPLVVVDLDEVARREDRDADSYYDAELAGPDSDITEFGRENGRTVQVVHKHATCRYCSRDIEFVGGQWVDPEATGDDAIWYATCESHDTFEADHEPVER